MGKMGRTMTMTLSVHIDLELPPIKNVWVNSHGAIESFKYLKTPFPGLTLTAFSMSRCKEKKEEEDQMQRTGRHQVVHGVHRQFWYVLPSYRKIDEIRFQVLDNNIGSLAEEENRYERPSSFRQDITNPESVPPCKTSNNLPMICCASICNI